MCCWCFCTYLFLQLSPCLLASSQVCEMCELMYRETSTHIQENEDVCTQKSSCFLFHTNTFASTFPVEQELSDNSPDGQTRNQTSISLPASSSPYPFNHSISFAHTHRHLPHTLKYNYIFHFPTAAVQLPRWQLPHLINQNHRGPLIVKNNKILSKPKTGITDNSGSKHSPRCRA